MENAISCPKEQANNDKMKKDKETQKELSVEIPEESNKGESPKKTRRERRKKILLDRLMKLPPQETQCIVDENTNDI